MQNVRGLGNAAGSSRATNLYIKVKYMRKKFKEARVVFATGTPVSNSLVEMFTLMRYLSPESLEKRNIEFFDAWAKVLGEVVTDFELTGVGRYKEVSRFSKFGNLPELLNLYGEFADRVDRKVLDATLASEGKRFPVPNLANGKPDNVVAERSKMQAELIGFPMRDDEGNILLPERFHPKTLLGRAQAVEGKRTSEGGDNILVVLSDARKIALDPRII